MGFIFSLLAQLAGLANALGWSTVALYGLFAVAFLYFGATTMKKSPA